MNLLRSRLLASLFAVGAAAGAAFAEGPFAIRTPQLMVPDEAAGSGLSPEVAVRLSIDERGRVAAVEVRSITPASDYDTFFRDQVVGTLSEWRFAPATSDGKAVASTLDWRVRFPVKAAVAESSYVFAPMPGADFEERRAAILALPVTIRRGMLEAEGRAALEVLDSKKKTEAATPRFIVRTDADDPRAAAVIAGNLEAIFNVLAAELLPGVELQPEPFKVLVFVYRSRSQFESFAANYPWGEGTSGYYSGTGLIAFSLEQPSNDEVMNILLHEATHAFLDRHILRPGVALPRWLGEGFAEYVGNSAVQKGRLQPGKTFAHKFAFQGSGVASFRTEAGFNLDAARTALRKGKGLGVEELLEASPEIFYGERSRLYYASAWLLVHYLRDGSPESAANRFPQLLLYLAEGYPQLAAFRAVYGPVDAADADFHRYVKEF
ncbi:MAG: energy transducer TonB [Thermoanaerobaculia bacterium]